MILTYTIGELFNNIGLQIAGSYEVFSILILLLILIFLIFIRAPMLLIITNTILIVGVISNWGLFTTKLLAIGAVIIGTMVALEIWRIYQKGEIP